MASKCKDKDKDDGVVVAAFSAKWVSWAHTVVAYGEEDPRQIHVPDGQVVLINAASPASRLFQCPDRRHLPALPQDC